MTAYLPVGEAAVKVYTKGLDEWKKMAKRAGTIYRGNISYGPTDRLGDNWQDRIPDFEKDMEDLENRLKMSQKLLSSADEALAKRAMKIALSEPKRPEVSLAHIPGKWFQSRKPFPIILECKSSMPQQIILYYRHVNHAEKWKSAEMVVGDGNIFKCEIPAEYTDVRFPLQYYFEVHIDSSNATLFPMLSDDLSNTPYYVVRRKEV
jgi:hypothetical protein